MSSVGIQFGQDVLNPHMRRGGLRAYPFGQVVSGCSISTPTAAAGVISIAIDAGVVVLDGQDYSIAGSTLTTPVMTVANGIKIPVYATPIRQVECKDLSQLVAGYGVDGDKAFYTVDIPGTSDNPPYKQLQGVYVKRAGVWIEQNNKVNPTEKDPIFTAPSRNHFALPFNDVTGGLYTLTEEQNVWRRNSGYPEFSPLPGPSFARIGASLPLGTLKLDLTAPGTIANYVLYKNQNAYS